MKEYSRGEIIRDGYRQFSVLEVLRGGMGIAYVVDVGSIVLRVLKTYRYIENTFNSRIYRDLFLNEAKVWLDISLAVKPIEQHPFFVRAYSICKVNKQPYIEIEYVNGGNVASLQSLTVPQAVDLAVQCCKGLDSLNRFCPGFVHGDIKPDNLLLKKMPDNSLVLKVTDFGLSRVNDLIRSNLPSDGIAHSTYCSPEQANRKPIDARSDIYSFGLVLFEMLALMRLPDVERERRVRELSRSIMNGQEPDITPLQNVPVAMVKILLTCLRLKPENRYPTFAHISDALNKVVDDEKWKIQEHNFVAAGGVVLVDTDYLHRDYRPEMSSYEAALGYADIGDVNNALRLFKSALQANEDNPRLWTAYGGFLVKGLQQPEEGLQWLLRAAARDQSIPHTWTFMGIAYEALGDKTKAIECYDRAISIDESFSSAWLSKGALLSNENMAKEAIVCFTRALNLNDDDVILHVNLGLTYVKLREFEKASKHFHIAYQQDPSEIKWLAWAGNYLCLAKKYEAGEQLLNDALHYDPEYALAYILLGACKNNQLAEGRNQDHQLRIECIECLVHAWILDRELAKKHHVEALFRGLGITNADEFVRHVSGR